jgi:hypothetical protein
MAQTMAEIIACPACQRKLQVPESHFGQTVQCPECRQMFTAEPPASQVQKEAPRAAPAVAEDRPRRRDLDDRAEDLGGHPPLRAPLLPHHGAVILTLGIMALVLLPFTAWNCGPMAWLMGNSDLAEIRAGRMDPDGEGIVQAGRVLGMIALGLFVLVLLFYCVIFGIVFGGMMNVG